MDGMIKRVLGRSMPIKPDFSISLNGDKIEPYKLTKGLVREWSIKDMDFQNKLKLEWDSRKTDLGLKGEYKIVQVDNEIIFPILGRVRVVAKLSNDSLRTGQESEGNRAYGFFIYVRGRLINPDDDKVTITDPSFASFYRTQYLIHADKLDEVLLADRERLANSGHVNELKIIQAAIYKTVKDFWAKSERDDAASIQFEQRLPVHERSLFSDPVASQISHLREKGRIVSENVNLDAPNIITSAEGYSQNISLFDLDADKPVLKVNVDHPYIKRQIDIAGTGQKGKALLREIENLALMETLFEGHLRFIGLQDHVIEGILAWRDKMYRVLSRLDSTTLDGAIERMELESYKGHTEFERAVELVLQQIGFITEHDGKSGKADLVINAKIGDKAYRMTFEPKGSGGTVGNAQAVVASAVSHAQLKNAEHAVIIARDFGKFRDADETAIIRECRSINQHSTAVLEDGSYQAMIDRSEAPTVSIMTTSNLALLARAVAKYQYPLHVIRPILKSILTPAKQQEMIQNLGDPLAEFDYKQLLHNIYTELQQKPERLSVGVGLIYSDYYSSLPSRGIRKKEDLIIKLSAIAQIAHPHIVLDGDDISLMQTPEYIATFIANQLGS